MAKFNTGQSFADGDTVTGAKLNNITSQLNIYTGVISEQTAMVATVSTADQLLIADTDNGDSGSANRVTVQKLLNDTLSNGTYTKANLTGATITNGTITNGAITNGTITNGTITNGVIPTGTFGTTTSTAATITNGTVQTLTASTANISQGSAILTQGTIGTLNSTTGTITNLSATTSTFLGTITGSTNVINIGSGQIYKNASGNVGIGITSGTSKLNIYGTTGAAGATWAGGSDVVLLSNNGPFSEQAIAFQEDPQTVGAKIGVKNTANAAYDIIFANRANTSTTSSITEKFRIASLGQLGIGGANYGTSGQVLTSAGASAAPSWSNVTLGTNSVTFQTLSTSTTEADNTAKRVAKAWVNFNGTGTVAIRASFNISSVTDITTGQYKANFTVAMSDVNYTALYSGGEATAYDPRSHNNILSQTTTGVTVYCVSPDANYRDTDPANVVVFK